MKHLLFKSWVNDSCRSGQITDETVRQLFAPAFRNAAVLTTEIGQVPLSAVNELIQVPRHRLTFHADATHFHVVLLTPQLAKVSGVPSMLDVDVPPSVATTEAGLGTHEQVGQTSARHVSLATSRFDCRMLQILQAVKGADVLKPSLGNFSLI